MNKKLTTTESLPKKVEEDLLERLQKQLGLTVLKSIKKNYGLQNCPRKITTAIGGTIEEQPRTIR